MRKYNIFLFVALVAIFLGSCQEYGLESNNKPQRAAEQGELIVVENVDAKIAGIAAKNFMVDLDESFSSSEIQKIDSISNENGRTSIYVFNFSDGFVLTSADKVNQPILAFSQDGEFESPFNSEIDNGSLQVWLTGIIERNDYISDYEGESDTIQLARITSNNQWNILIEKDNYCLTVCSPIYINPLDTCGRIDTTLYKQDQFYGPYCTTRWMQKQPYNRYTPVINEINAPVGCVAVAMGQIMRYHKKTGGFSWSIMPDICSSSYSNMTAGEHEVAKFLRHIGNNVNMSYGYDGSGAIDFMAYWAFRYKYDYNSKMGKYNEATIKNELLNKRPVYLSGDRIKDSGDKVGHAWVCDGWYTRDRTYEDNCGIKHYYHYDFFHMNWGNNYENLIVVNGLGYKKANGSCGWYSPINITLRKEDGLDLYTDFKYPLNNKMIYNIYPK